MKVVFGVFSGKEMADVALYIGRVYKRWGEKPFRHSSGEIVREALEYAREREEALLVSPGREERLEAESRGLRALQEVIPRQITDQHDEAEADFHTLDEDWS